MRSMLVLLLLAACGESQSVPSTSHANAVPHFLAVARAAVPMPFEGTVTQVVPAGGYTYLLVNAGPDDARWVVVIRREVSVGDALSVRPYGQLEDFQSKRTGLTFERLVFASITTRSV